MRRRFALILPALLAAAPLPAQQGATEDAGALLDRAERMQDAGDDAGALRVIAGVLPSLTRDEDRALRMRALVLRCWSVVSTAEPAAALALAERDLAAATRPEDAGARAALRTCRGYAHEVAGRVDPAFADYERATAEARRAKDAKALGRAVMLRGELRYYRGDMAGALQDLNEAWALHTRRGDNSSARYTLNAIANVYADTRVAQYDRAIEYYRQVLAANEAAGRAGNVATALFNLGSTLERKGDLEGALGYYRRALEAEVRLGDEGEAASSRRAIGAALARLGRPAEAIRWLEQALAYAERTGDAERAAIVRLSRGAALRKLGRHDEALRDLDAARVRFEAGRNARYLESVHDERAQALAAGGDWRGAFEARSAQVTLQRELADQAREEQTSRLRVQFDTEKKEQENRALLRENALRGQALRDEARIRRLQTAVIALGAAMMAVLAALVFRHLANARRMRTLALTDELTRLPNRRHLLRLADERVKAARAGAGPLSVLALDVDHFKRINDTHGHEAGDAVLARVAAACRGALRHDDAIGRTGGEEFVALLPRSDAAAAREVAERLRQAVERAPWDEVAPGLRVTVSVGVAEWAPADPDFAALARRADDSLYRAKNAGRNRIETAAAPA